MAAKTGESKQAVIIMLVISVLLIIVLGVVAYYGHADQARLTDEKKDAESKLAAMQKSRDWEQFKAYLLKVYCGHGTKDDLESLAQMRPNYDSGSLGGGEKDKADVDAMVKKLDDPNLLGWNPAEKKPQRTYTDLVNRLSADLAKAYASVDREKTAAKNKEEELQGLLQANEAALRKALGELAAAQKTNVQYQLNKSKEYLESLTRNETLDKENEDLKKKIYEIEENRDKQYKKFQNDIQDLEIKQQKTEEKVPVKSLLDYDTPKGRIVTLDRSGKVAYINLGSADNVQPQLTFSIVGVAAGGDAKRQQKGSLQVANVLSDHLSAARITEVYDPNRNPIVTNDLLFNPAWSPNLREHIAIAGLIDLTGDGRDNTQEFIKNLQQQGILVDAYLDLKDLTVKGRGLSFQTNYLVLGDIPEFNTADQVKEGDIRVERKKDIIAKVTEMQSEARRYGATIVPLRRFVSLIGYRLPRAAMMKTEPDFNLYRMTPASAEPAER